MNVNICANRYSNIRGNWEDAYIHTIEAFKELNYSLNISNHIYLDKCPEYVTRGIVDSEEDIYLYNHTYKGDIVDTNFFTGSQTIFLKPTGPTPNYFSLDTYGYAAASSITYKRPEFDTYDYTTFFAETVPNIKQQRESKWSDRDDLQFSTNKISVPKNHTLVLGQMPGDETVTRFSFGHHWEKLKSIVDTIKDKKSLVVKLHPTLQTESLKNGGWTFYMDTIATWVTQGITVFYGFESLHDILPYTKVAITENSTSGIECLLYEVPLISYGYPEYHWVTKDLRHLNTLQEYIEDLSWWDQDLSKKWVAWYCESYLCYNAESTRARLKSLLEPIYP